MMTDAAKHSLVRACVLSCLVFLLFSTFTGVAAERKMASLHPTLKRNRRSQSQYGERHKGSHQQHQHHRPLTDEQQADQNLQFMLSLYRSAAEPDGRPKQYRKFGSNTVRLLRPSASSVHYMSASRDHRYTFTVEYNLDGLPLQQLIRASFVHFRSPSPSSSSPPTPPRCRARVAGVTPAPRLTTLEPRDPWTETDITAHVLWGGAGGRAGAEGQGHLTLTAQYWCTEPPTGAPLWPVWGERPAARRRRSPVRHLRAPSLLLYLEELREVSDWMADLLGGGVEGGAGPASPALLRRRRRSKDGSSPSSVSQDGVTSPPPAPLSTPPPSILADIPAGFKRGSKAAVGGGNGAPSRSRCKLHSFRLSFDELGWGHYFIAPPVYNPRYCRGDCPRVLHYGYHSPNHAIIQTAISDMGVGEVPAPSCVPYRYAPMSVLVMHHKKVEYRELEDMVAESCTCR